MLLISESLVGISIWIAICPFMILTCLYKFIFLVLDILIDKKQLLKIIDNLDHLESLIQLGI